MNALKTVGIALFVAVVTAASVVWYIDYRISQMAEAVMAPIHETTDRVDRAIQEVGDSVETATGAVESTVDETRSRIAENLEGARSDIEYEVENVQDLAGRIGDWLSSVTT
ncbi:MAG: hypothetical protein PVJ28_02680 [Acidimicrobiia bacterium]|jgi:uncharacterized protein YoxC